MQFKIIRNSESHTGFDIPDREYKGQAAGLVHGWSFEFTNDNGEFSYNSVYYSHGTPEDNADERFQFETERMNGWKPTGRVVFRGYGQEHYDSDEREWFVEDVTEEEISRCIDAYGDQPHSEAIHGGMVYVRPHTRRGRKVGGFYRKKPSR